MAHPAFDTQEVVEILKTISDNMVTQSDLSRIESEIKSEIKSEMKALKSEIKLDIKSAVDSFENKLESLKFINRSIRRNNERYRKSLRQEPDDLFLYLMRAVTDYEYEQDNKLLLTALYNAIEALEGMDDQYG